jgi:hypothetical protein
MIKNELRKSVDSSVVVAEIAYILNKVMLTYKYNQNDKHEKKKDCVNHYSQLYKATMDKLSEFGITNGDTKTKWGASYKLMIPTIKSKNYKKIVEFLGKKFEPNINKAELDYIVEKIRLAKEKDDEKKFTCHYSALHKSTLDTLSEIGIKFDLLGSHGYRFYFPEKKSKSWYRLNMYGKSVRDENGCFVKK